LKPQLKNVTASDVANSLYYLHLNSEEDARLIDEEQPPKSDTESISSTQKPLPRKPLPDSARSSLDINRQSAPPLVKLDSNSNLSVKRKPISSTDTTPNTLEPPQSKPPLSRRPLGPRPLSTEASISRRLVPGSEGQHNDGHSLASRDPSPYRPSVDSERGSFVRASQYGEVEQHKKVPAFTITIIRRDPSSDSQWNVGTISGTPATEGTDRPTIATQQSKRPYFNMSVHLTTPGYGPFRHSYMTSQMEGKNKPSGPPRNSMAAESGPGKQPQPNYSFDREIRMEGSDFWTRTSFQHKRTKSDMSPQQGITRGRSFSGSEGMGSAQPSPAAQESHTSAKGYMFISPWGGRCKFSTSSSGRSLRCSHTLPEPVSANDAMESYPPAQASVAVSEIRFNLPSAAIFNSVAETLTKLEKDHPRLSIIRNKLISHKSSPSSHSSRPHDDEGPPLPPRPYRTSFQTSSDDETGRHPRGSQPGMEDDDHHFDLSLGKEKAGGGNRGKRAKLGKLIIHDEGFKFLDLLVSSNMAVWWSVWEPDF